MVEDHLGLAAEIKSNLTASARVKAWRAAKRRELLGKLGGGAHEAKV